MEFNPNFTYMLIELFVSNNTIELPPCLIKYRAMKVYEGMEI
jgi:hypothetical protein